MVLQWYIQNSEKYAFRERDEAQKARVSTAAALLTSLIADADVVTDWVYFAEIVSRDNSGDGNEDPIPSWIRGLQLVSCICGTLSWMAISSDGRLMDWLRRAAWWILWGGWWVAYVISFQIPAFFIKWICCGKIDIQYGDCRSLDHIKCILNRAKIKLNRFFDEGFRVPSGGLLMMGILSEDLPQIIVTFLIENAIEDEKGISRSAYLNLIVAIFDILHKLASAWDDRKLYIPTGTGIRTFVGHTSSVTSLAAVGLDRIISASQDGTARLWDIATSKTVQTFDLSDGYWDGSVVKLDDDRILTTSSNSDGLIKEFNIKSGECLKTVNSRGAGNEKCSAVSNNSEYILTSEKSSDKIIRWDANILEMVQTYHGKAHSLLMIGNGQFVFANETEGKRGHPILLDVASGDIIRTFKLKKGNSKVTAMCKCDEDSFLVASRSIGNSMNTCIEMFTVGQSDPIRTRTIEGYKFNHLASVGDDQFVTCEYNSNKADLWDISSGSHLHTFEGHNRSINDILYLPMQGAIATASDDGSVKVWPIPKLVHGNADADEDSDGGNDDHNSFNRIEDCDHHFFNDFRLRDLGDL